MKSDYRKYKHYGLEFLVVFLGVLISFQLQNYSQSKAIKSKNELFLKSLVSEIDANIAYCEEHLSQLKNMLVINETIEQEFRFDKPFLMKLHNANPFGHSYLEDGSYRYWTAPSDYENLYLWMITWWNTFAQNEIYFNSLVSNGLLLEIKDADLRNRIEGIYSTKKRRVIVNEQLLKANSDKIFEWAEAKRDASVISRSRDYVFTELKDLQLKNLIEDRSYRIELRVMSLEHYIQSLYSVREDLAQIKL
ncbi:MAG: hypothetical protein ACPGIE_08990 [Flavobacteriaceae bacterium]